jgi:hypothetical protein
MCCVRASGAILLAGDTRHPFGVQQPMSQIYYGHPDLAGGDLVFGQPDAMSELFSGDPNYEIMGAIEILGNPAASPAAKMQAARKLQMAALAGQAGDTRVRQQHPQRGYEQILPVESLAIAANTARTITLTPQRTFRPEKLRVSSTHSAPFFALSQFNIGAEPQLIASGSVPCDLFSEVAIYSQTKAETANLGNQITLVVTNLDLVNARDFRGAIFGTALSMH